MLTINTPGFTLIEVLISLVLLSLILLGFDSMELYSLRSVRATYDFHVAANQWLAMAERLRAVGERDPSAQIAIWNLQNKELLLDGKGTVSGQFPSYTITVYWGKASGECKQMQLGQSGCIRQSVQ